MSLWDKILRLFGTSEQQIRWRRHLRDKERDAGRAARENRDRHLKYQHKVCPECGSVNDREAQVCAVCEAKLPTWRSAQIEKWVGRMSPGIGAMTNVLLIVNGLIFVAVVLDSGDVWRGPANAIQSIAWGANYGPLMSAGGEWWRLITANFLHVGGLMHVGFNLIALAQIGPLVERFYGTSRATVIYLGTAILSCVASHLWNPLAISGGASGAIMGLVGAGVVAGHLQGGPMGRAVRNSLLKWVLFIAVFGFIVPNIDNAAHFGGLVAGAVLGAGLKQGRDAARGSRWAVRVTAALLVAVTTLGLVLGGVGVLNESGEFTQAGLERANFACDEAVEGVMGQLRTMPSGEVVVEADPALVRAAAESCDRAARIALFYADYYPTQRAANLWRMAGEPGRAERIEAIYLASGRFSWGGR